MNVPAPQGLVLVFVCAALALVGIVDLKFRTIPNELVGVLGAAGLLHAFVLGGGRSALVSLLGAVAGLALLCWPFSRGLLGGGDVKLLGALGCWVGPIGAVRVLCVGAVAGGLLAVVFLVRMSRTQRAEVGQNLAAFARVGELSVPPPEKIERSRGIPYGVALAAAGAWLLCSGAGR